MATRVRGLISALTGSKEIQFIAVQRRASFAQEGLRENDRSVLRGENRLPILPLTAEPMEEPSSQRLFARLTLDSTQIQRRHLVPALQLLELFRQTRDNEQELAAQAIPSNEYQP
jgi:hypothetical protein